MVEIRSKLIDLHDLETTEIDSMLNLFPAAVPFTQSQAKIASELRRSTRHLGLSLADRSCLALAIELGAPVYTADRAWMQAGVDCEVHLVR